MLRFSVVIPVHNREGSVANAVRSALRAAAGSPLTEIIVVDDASTDRSVEVVRAVFAGEIAKGSVIVIEHARNRGVHAARNTGVEAATGSWIVFLDSDDELAVPLAAISADIEADGVEAGLVFFQSRTFGGALTGRQLEGPTKFDLRRMVREGFPGECMAVAERRLLLLHPFDETMRGFEGLHWARILETVPEIVVWPTVTRLYSDDPAGNRLSTRAAVRARSCELARGWTKWVTSYWRLLGPVGVGRAAARVAYYSALCAKERLRSGAAA